MQKKTDNITPAYHGMLGNTIGCGHLNMPIQKKSCDAFVKSAWMWWRIMRYHTRSAHMTPLWYDTPAVRQRLWHLYWWPAYCPRHHHIVVGSMKLYLVFNARCTDDFIRASPTLAVICGGTFIFVNAQICTRWATVIKYTPKAERAGKH